MTNLQDELRKAGPDKIIFMVETEFETESQLLGLDGKKLYQDTSWHPNALKRNFGVVLQLPERFTPDIPWFQEHRSSPVTTLKSMRLDVNVGDTIYFDQTSIGNGRQLGPGIYWLRYPEIIAKEVTPLNIDFWELKGPNFQQAYEQTRLDYFRGLNPKGVTAAADPFIEPIGTHVLLKPVYKDTVVEIDPVNQPGVMGEVNKAGLVTTTDQHLKGAGEIGAFKVVYEEKPPDWQLEGQEVFPERLLVNDLYVRNQAAIAYIGHNVRNQAPVARKGDKVLVNLFSPNAEGLLMPNVPTIKIHGEEYFYLRQHQIEGVFIDV